MPTDPAPRRVAVPFETIDEVLAVYGPLLPAIAAAVGPRCEVVLHDLSAEDVDLSATIVAIAHGEVSGRDVGGPSSNLGFEVLADGDEDHDAFGYGGRTRDGRELRSSSLYLRNAAGRVIAALCINYDLSAVRALQSLAAALDPVRPAGSAGAEGAAGAAVGGAPGAEAPQEVLGADIGDVVEDMITRAIAETGREPGALGRDEKVRIVRRLDERGVTRVGDAMRRIAARLEVSRSTAYQYLDEARRRA
ncbi:DNA-binding protein [Brachybacterium phenoliresistens]|uniref:DNA-binding protein n=1 Tax=Brachybacterium phenoliresistens TaxID=396014 RepID=Z9JWJ2_9MICO|nr:helix-turn-helix transcriptional regulator [Brachybacterium phenoliresistens]EWS82388.1 DNA-binding protein [Brachybacterium phenoliresistens]